MDIAVWSLIETMFMIFCSTLPTLRPWLSLLISRITNASNPSAERTLKDSELTFGQASARRQEESFLPSSATTYLLSPSPSAEAMELPPIKPADPQSPEKVHIAFLQIPDKKVQSIQ